MSVGGAAVRDERIWAGAWDEPMVAGRGACRRPFALLFLFVSVDNKVDGSKLQTAAAASQLLERRGLAVRLDCLASLCSRQQQQAENGIVLGPQSPIGPRRVQPWKVLTRDGTKAEAAFQMPPKQGRHALTNGGCPLKCRSRHDGADGGGGGVGSLVAGEFGVNCWCLDEVH